jgi:hypothetical protein
MEVSLGKYIVKLFTILIFSIGLSHATDNDNGLNRLGEIEDCPKGCECITDSARGKTDKSGIVKALEDDRPREDADSGTSTESK